MEKVAKVAATVLLSTALVMTACSKESGNSENSAAVPIVSESPNQTPHPTDNVEEQVKTQSDSLFWKPPEGWVGDLMPFNDENGNLYLYYLQDWRDGAPGFHPWHLVTTENLTDYHYEGEVIPVGYQHEPDLAIGTGSVIQVGDTYHGFYTGHNWKFPDQGKPKEAMMHAVSDDLKTWTKLPEHTFVAPEGYEIHDFRDPYLFYHEQAEEYRMLVSARKEGVGGVLAVFSSKDLEKWELREPLEIEAASSFFMLECADIFYSGDKWYLVFSEFSDKKATHYRVSDSIDGPWMLPEDGDDLFDGRSFYAAKTGKLGDQRYLFGWVPTRAMEKDFMNWDWAGNLVAHQLVTHTDSTLGVKVPDQIDQYISQEVELKMKQQLGQVSAQDNQWYLDGSGDISGIVFESLPIIAKITGTFRFEAGTTFTGFVAGVSEEPEKAYGIQVEPNKQRIRYDAVHGAALTSVDPDVSVSIPFQAGIDYTFTIVIEDDVAVFYVDDHALTTRMYKMPGGAWGWYSRGGTTTLSNLQLFTP